ncbi:MAG: fatty acid desaturase family protein [Gammaproteobacteria bacterium]|jgi:omega-6 fatty acid desaturase (delta-12 desaturase)
MLPTYKEVQLELRKHIRINSALGFNIYFTDMVLYAISIYAVLILPELWMKLIASVFAGFKISNLSVIAHDAAHNSLTKSKKLNKFIAITSLLPCLFNYRLWLYDHNYIHHTKTNEESFPDSYTPLSKEKYDSLTSFGKWKERLYRKPSFLYFGLYYICERWMKVKFYPTKNMPEKIKKRAWKYFSVLMLYFSVFMGILFLAPLYSSTGIFTAVTLGFILPFYIFNTLYAFAVYMQHTHPDVAWFETAPDRKVDGRQEFISVQIAFPDWFNIFAHNIFDHGAHHACPAIPCYRLGKAQKKLNEMLGENALTYPFSVSSLFEIMETCKLYDYENGCWLDFDGNRTSKPKLNDTSAEYAKVA